MTIALIDADIITYEVGFAGDTIYYMVGGRKFKYAKTAKNWCMAHGLSFEAINKVHEAGSFDDIVVEIDNLIDGICQDTEANESRLFLSGSSNFRDGVATTAEYKGNRDRAKRPKHYEAIKEHLQDRWGATVVEGYEADDAMGIAQCLLTAEHKDSVICSRDKDMLTIPGWHYNWKTRAFKEVSENESWRNFYKQLLTGDRADNIIGLTGIGDKTAARILSYMHQPQDMLCEVGRQYIREFDNPEDRLLENATLLYIHRKENDYWHFDKHLEN